MNSTDQLEKIRKLLAMAEGGGLSDEARDSYNAKAAELIAKYGVDQALLDAQAPTKQKATDVVITCDPPYALDKIGLLNYVATALRCKTVRLMGHSSAQKVHLFGMESDLRRVELLFTSLLVQAAHGLATTTVPYNQNATSYRKSWLAGFGSAISRRLRDAEQRAEQESGTPGTALVLRDRSALVEERVGDVYPRLRRTTRRLNGSGRSAGYAAGTKADIGGSKLNQGAGPRSIR